MRILIVSGSFFPGISPRAFRTSELAKELAARGHELTVLIPKIEYDYSNFENENNLLVKDLGPRNLDTIKLGKSGFLKIQERIIFRILHFLFEYPSGKLMFQVNRALKMEQGYDMLISIAVPYPIHWGVLLARSSRHSIAPVWVADCGDPYTGFQKTFFYKAFYLRMLTSAVFKRCSYITVPFEGALKAYPAKFHSRMRIIPQGFKLSDVDVFRGEPANKVPTLGYAGSFIPGRRDPRPFIDFLLKEEVNFRFIIYTSQEGLFSKYSGIVGSKLFVNPYIGRKELLFELSRMDFLINFSNRNEIQSPSKIIDYALTGRPILSLDSYAFDPDQVRAFISGDFSSRLKVDVDQYDIRNVANSFMDLSE